MILSFYTAIVERKRSSIPTGQIRKFGDVGLPRPSGRVRSDAFSLSNIQNQVNKELSHISRGTMRKEERRVWTHMYLVSGLLWADMGKGSGCGMEAGSLLRMSCQDAPLQKTVLSSNSNIKPYRYVG